MRRRLRHSIGTFLLVGWCLLFLRCETTEKSMVRALYLAQNEATVTVGLLYQAPEASADASEASAAMQMRLAEESTLEKALSSVQKKLPQKADYRLCDFLIISENTSEELLSAYESIRSGKAGGGVRRQKLPSLQFPRRNWKNSLKLQKGFRTDS